MQSAGDKAGKGTKAAKRAKQGSKDTKGAKGSKAAKTVLGLNIAATNEIDSNGVGLGENPISKKKARRKRDRASDQTVVDSPQLLSASDKERT